MCVCPRVCIRSVQYAYNQCDLGILRQALEKTLRGMERGEGCACLKPPDNLRLKR